MMDMAVGVIIGGAFSGLVESLTNNLMSLGKKKEEPKAPTTKTCPFCMSEIPIEATRCPHCTSVLEEAKETVQAEAAAAAEA